MSLLLTLDCGHLPDGYNNDNFTVIWVGILFTSLISVNISISMDLWIFRLKEFYIGGSVRYYPHIFLNQRILCVQQVKKSYWYSTIQVRCDGRSLKIMQ